MRPEFMMVGRTNAPFTHNNTISGIIQMFTCQCFTKIFLSHLSAKSILNKTNSEDHLAINTTATIK